MNKTTPADPGAIDLEAIKAYRGVDQVFFAAAICDLIAAVEALRERVVALKVEKQGGWECLIKRAEAAEARVVELKAALKSIRGYFTVIRRKVRKHPPSALISLTVDTLATEAITKLDMLDKKN